MPSTSVQVNLEPLRAAFKSHLDAAINKRIIFSAPFGTGKSTFIKEFFQGNEDYISVNIYPVNYSVVSTQDIFELIKYDIAIELMAKFPDKVKLEKDDFSLFFSGQFFAAQKMEFLPLLTPVISLNETIGKPAVPLLLALKNTITDFAKFRKTYRIDERKQLIDYLNQIEKTKGTYQEFDGISQLITRLLIRINDSEQSPKKTVLIIDDLDRLDPEHVFRLFNVFSAHYDSVTERNKFGFDKVIFICDIENIRRIFHHRYGERVDFSGYIDKFFSAEIYHFDSLRFLIANVKSVVQALPVSNKQTMGQSENIIRHILEWLVYLFIETRLINFRNLLMYPQVEIKDKLLPLHTSTRYYARQFSILQVFQMAEKLFPSPEIFHDKLEELARRISSNGALASDLSFADYRHIPDHVIEKCLYFVLDPATVFSPVSDDNTQYTDEIRDMGIRVTFTRSRKNHSLYDPERFDILEINDRTGTKRLVEQLEIVRILLKTYEICLEKKILPI